MWAYAKHVSMQTVWVFGDQLNRQIGALREAKPATHRVLMVESRGKISSRRWHIQRAHFIVASMRRFAEELRAEGFDVDYRFAETMTLGLAAHRTEYSPSIVVVTEPNSFVAQTLVASLDVEVVRSNQFLCHPDEYSEFMGTRKTIKMEDFYRWQRRRLNILMDGNEPTEGQWNFDADNRLPPPKTGHDRWPPPHTYELDDLDQRVIADVSGNTWGDMPTGVWATTRTEAIERLNFFISEILPMFGEHEDAMLKSNWHLAHSLLSPYLNNGLLLPGEVVAAAEAGYRSGSVHINSAEGFIRQIIGWREYIWNCYWRWMPEYAEMNSLDAQVEIP
ncbi:MAG: hypothetical protein RL114_1441, partial [Actinomycetota bacterium]